MRTSVTLAPGSPARVRLPGAAGPLEVRARVAWCAEQVSPGRARLGLAFEDAGRSAVEALRGMGGSVARAP